MDWKPIYSPVANGALKTTTQKNTNTVLLREKLNVSNRIIGQYRLCDSMKHTLFCFSHK